MKDFIKKGAKEAADLGGSAMKVAMTAILTEIAKDILEETGAADVAKDKLMEVGMKLVNDMGMDPKELQKDLLKKAIKKELDIE